VRERGVDRAHAELKFQAMYSPAIGPGLDVHEWWRARWTSGSSGASNLVRIATLEGVVDHSEQA